MTVSVSVSVIVSRFIIFVVLYHDVYKYGTQSFLLHNRRPRHYHCSPQRNYLLLHHLLLLLLLLRTRTSLPRQLPAKPLTLTPRMQGRFVRIVVTQPKATRQLKEPTTSLLRRLSSKPRALTPRMQRRIVKIVPTQPWAVRQLKEATTLCSRECARTQRTAFSLAAGCHSDQTHLHVPSSKVLSWTRRR